MPNYLQGKFEPTNPLKYIGDVSNIKFRSSWEKKFMIWCDNTDAVVKWNSEELVIPYISPVDNRPHRYFVDAVIQVKDKSGKLKMYAVEIKPKKETEIPKTPKRMSKAYLKEIATYSVNQAKWKAATEWCESNDMSFTILTEDHLGV
jgi:hypothetical protein